MKEHFREAVLFRNRKVRIQSSTKREPESEDTQCIHHIELTRPTQSRSDIRFSTDATTARCWSPSLLLGLVLHLRFNQRSKFFILTVLHNL
jgi:hypothetical protein